MHISEVRKIFLPLLKVVYIFCKQYHRLLLIKLSIIILQKEFINIYKINKIWRIYNRLCVSLVTGLKGGAFWVVPNYTGVCFHHSFQWLDRSSLTCYQIPCLNLGSLIKTMHSTTGVIYSWDFIHELRKTSLYLLIIPYFTRFQFWSCRVLMDGRESLDPLDHLAL